MRGGGSFGAGQRRGEGERTEGEQRKGLGGFSPAWWALLCPVCYWTGLASSEEAGSCG